jgi:hypothetical protein
MSNSSFARTSKNRHGLIKAFLSIADSSCHGGLMKGSPAEVR